MKLEEIMSFSRHSKGIMVGRDVQAILNALDRDGDGKLSLEDGVKSMQKGSAGLKL